MTLYRKMEEAEPIVGEAVQVLTHDGPAEGIYLGKKGIRKWFRVLMGGAPQMLDVTGNCVRYWKPLPEPNVVCCKKCGAPIIFIPTPKGRVIPCDSDRQLIEHVGNEVFVNDFGNIVRGQKSNDPDYCDDAGYTPHWATCPFASEFRKRRQD